MFIISGMKFPECPDRLLTMFNSITLGKRVFNVYEEELQEEARYVFYGEFIKILRLKKEVDEIREEMEKKYDEILRKIKRRPLPVSSSPIEKYGLDSCSRFLR